MRKGTLRVDIETDDGPASYLLQSGEAMTSRASFATASRRTRGCTEVIEFSTHHRSADSYRTDHGRQP